MKLVFCCNAFALMKLVGTATLGLVVHGTFKDAEKYFIMVQLRNSCCCHKLS